MSDVKDTPDKPKGRKPLVLKRSVETGAVRQSFSHGRSKSVVVEKKRKRAVGPGEGGETVAAPASKTTTASAPQPGPKPKAGPKPVQSRSGGGSRRGPGAGSKPGPQGVRSLSEAELEARRKALELAKAQEIERQRQEAEAAAARSARAKHDQKALEDRKRREREEAEAAELAAEEARLAAEAEQARLATEAKSPERKPKDKDKERDKPGKATGAEEPDGALADLGGRIKQKRAAPTPKTPGKPGKDQRRRGKLTITSALEDDEERQRSLASVKRAREREKRAAQERREQPQKVTREVTIPETITIQELANRMATRAADIIKYLMKEGQMATINDVLDADDAQLIAEEFGHAVKRVSAADVEEGLSGDDDDEKDLKPRPPVVTVMGHVDHGKTSLLDAMRRTDVVAGEAGGITQHIGAYQITTANGNRITFLDTPGHEAFTQMRSRGAKVTDIVILVVAADDGVMPQTVEAINHAKAAGVPIILAINKIDKPDADPSRVRNELLQHEVIVESLGGDVQEVEVSALQKLNLEGLEEAISLQSEVLELKANPDRAAEGVVVESQLDKGRGPVATVLVQRGSMKRGDILVAGAEWGKVRALVDDKGAQSKAAGPTMPVEVLGLNGVPDPGDQVVVVENEARAREISEYRQRIRNERQSAATGKRSLEQLMSQMKDDEVKELAVVVKGDVQGSVEAIAAALEKISTDEVVARVIHSGVGAISESDVALAEASDAAIFGFNVRANKQAREAAERSGLDIRYYSVIYDLVDDVKQVLSGMLAPEVRETFIGYAEILEVFNITKIGNVAGCRITEGKVERGVGVRLLRDDVVIHEGKLKTLKRFKDEVNEVNAGQECGMAFENYEDIKKGDVIECFRVEELERTIA